MGMYESPVLDVSDIPQIALDSMNQTHKEEVELINKLGELLEEGMKSQPDADAITAMLTEWLEHTREHFASENQLMQEHGFPAYPVHANEHQQVLVQIEAIYQRWLDDNEVQPLADFIFSDWPQWFDNHVNSMDMVTAQYLSQIMRS